jgi:alginate O-acetyltransferase complex protein AlgI
MLFNSLQYGVFFVAVLVLHWLMPQRWRRPFLLLASYYFYASAIPQYIMLILGLTAFNYAMGLLIARLAGRGRTMALWLAIAGDLGMLGYFKYSQLLATTVQRLLSKLPLLGPSIHDPITLNILLPLGISFFSFEFIHYVVEVHKGQQPMRNPVDFALFAAFFPTQIAGPIKRFPDFVKQLQHPLRLRDVDANQGTWLILRGLVKKVIVADVLAPLVASAFATPATLGAATAWFAVFAFATQIYCDFSGYTDIGRGSAMLLGYSVPENFNSPYQSSSPAEFWHRWHISLSTWLRDYLYIPLGGSRVPRWRIYLNLMITMALGGLWHGASWHFMVWGIYQGVLLCSHRLWERTLGRTAFYRRLMCFAPLDFLRRPITLVLVCVGWVFFRADSLMGAFQMLRSMVDVSRPLTAGNQAHTSSSPALLMAIVAVIVVAGWIASVAGPRLGKDAQLVVERIRGFVGEGVHAVVLRPALYAGCIMLLMLWPPHAATTFIYFRF